MKRKVEIIAYHGWGMNAQFWNEWDNLFGEQVTFLKNDRGYFNEPVEHHFSDNETIKVLFVEGFGMHWVSRQNWKKANLIVLFSAFNNLRDIMSKTRQVDSVISQLKANIEQKPYYTLELFWKQLFRSEQSFLDLDNFDIQDQELLKIDLDAYHENLVISVPVNDKAKVILYETMYDDISPNSQKLVIKELFGRLNYYHAFDFLGHGYPFIHADECFKDLTKKLKFFD